MALCIYCNKTKGKRPCPARGGLICPSCCGRHRGVRIACPITCRYFREHEGYQRVRETDDFAEAWAASVEPFHKQGRTGLLDIAGYLQFSIYQFYRDKTSGTDAEIAEALEYLKRRLSSIAIVEVTGTPLGQYLWQSLQAYLKQQSGNAEEAAEAVESSLRFLKTYAPDPDARKYFHGLLGYVERYFDLPKELKEAPPTIVTPQIVTPEQLRGTPAKHAT